MILGTYRILILKIWQETVRSILADGYRLGQPLHNIIIPVESKKSSCCEEICPALIWAKVNIISPCDDLEIVPALSQVHCLTFPGHSASRIGTDVHIPVFVPSELEFV